MAVAGEGRTEGGDGREDAENWEALAQSFVLLVVTMDFFRGTAVLKFRPGWPLSRTFHSQSRHSIAQPKS